MIVLADGTKVYPEDIENTLAADPRIEAVATPLRPEVATIVGLQRPGEDIQVHAVFLVKDKEQVASVVRDTNVKLSNSQQIRGWTIWPEDEFPTTPTQKVKKRLVIEQLLNMGRVDQAKAASSERAVTRELTEVETLIAQAANVPPAAVHPGATLSADLGLDSLGRVDLLGAIEEELGAYIDDAAVEPNATVADRGRMVADARDVKRDTGIYGWPLSPLVRSFGLLLQQTLVYPLVHVFYKVKITGQEKLHGLRGPVMFAPKHCLHWDKGIILRAIQHI